MVGAAPVTSFHAKLLFVWTLVLVWLFGSFALAQQGNVLPGPVPQDVFQDYQKTQTSCEKCKVNERAYHNQIDVYEAARQAYASQVSKVQQSGDQYLEARANSEQLDAIAQRLDDEATDLLFNRDRDTSLGPYYEKQREADDANDEATSARGVLNQKRADLSAQLRELERLRVAALLEMRITGRRFTAMIQCELTCTVEELDLDAPEITTGQDPVETVNLPEIENFFGIVAKCAKCQPLAEQVNSIRSARRSIATSAQMTHQSLLANRQTLVRMQHERVALIAKEQLLFRDLLNSFTPAPPGENEQQIEHRFDQADQNDATRRLRELANQRSELDQSIDQIARLITQLETGLEKLLADYRAETVRLEAAQKALAECEKTCPPEKEGDIGFNPLVDPAYPQPESFFAVMAKCWQCQPHADAINQALSERFSVAGNIQDVVWLLKGRKRSLERLQTQQDALDTEERNISDRLWRDGVSETDRKAMIDRLIDIDFERTPIQFDILSISEEITDLDAKLTALLARHEALNTQIADLRTQLAKCEETCGPPEPDDIISVPDFYDPAYPQPENFIGVVAKCFECQPLADQLNSTLSKRYSVASDIQSTVDRIKHNSGVLADLRTKMTELLAREEVLNPVWTGSENEAEREAAKDELNQIDLDRVATEIEIEAFEKIVSDDEATLNDLLAEHTALTTLLEQQKGQLAECEKNCPDPDDDSKIAIPGFDEFITTDCEPCQALASQINDAVGTFKNAEQELEKARTDFAADHAQSQSRQERLDELLLHESDLSEEWLTTNDADRRAEIDAELNEMDIERNRLEDEKANEPAAVTKGQKAIDDARKRVDELRELLTQLRAQLVECEKQCADPDEGDDAGVDVPGDEDGFITTNCPPCEAIASLLNDVVGTLKGAQAELNAAKAKLEQFDAAATARDAAMAANLAREAALNEEALTISDADRQAEINTELHEVDAERHALEDARDTANADKELAQEKLATAQKRVDDLTKMEADLRAQLAECEKQCTDPEGDDQTGIDPGDGDNGDDDNSPFVSTDCAPCAAIASLLNDVIGSIPGTEADLTEARTALEAVRAEIAEKEAAKATAQDTFAAAMLEKSRLEAAGEDGSAQTDIINEHLDIASDLLTEIENLEIRQMDLEEKVEQLETRLAELKKQETDLRTKLAECEKQCTDPDENNQTDVGDDPGDADPKVARVPDISVEKSQPQACDAGQTCAFAIGVTAANDAPYTGPIFIKESRPVATGANGAAFGDWYCSPSRRNNSICYTHVDQFQGGQLLSLNVDIALPNRVGGSAQNCATHFIAKNERLTIQAVQLALAARGFDVGAADGIAGPRTRAALTAFGEQTGQTINVGDMPDAHLKLFGTPPPASQESTGSNNAQACIPLLINRPTPTSQTDLPPEDEDIPPIDDEPTPGIRIEFPKIDEGDKEVEEEENIGIKLPGLGIELPSIGGIKF